MRTTESDPQSYLETDARIIAENDGHVVLAVKIHKSWLHRNLHVLAALADSTARPCMTARKKLKGHAR